MRTDANAEDSQGQEDLDAQRARPAQHLHAMKGQACFMRPSLYSACTLEPMLHADVSRFAVQAVPGLNLHLLYQENILFTRTSYVK